MLSTSFIQDAVLGAVAIQRDLVVSTLKDLASNKFKCIGPVGEEGQCMSGSLV